jgi:hypothetical protein
LPLRRGLMTRQLQLLLSLFRRSWRQRQRLLLRRRRNWLLRRQKRKPQPFKPRKIRLLKMPSKLRPFRKRRKKQRQRLRLKLPPLWHNQRKVRPAMQMRMMQRRRFQSALRSRTVPPALRIQGSTRIRGTRKTKSDEVFESKQHSRR